MAGSCDVTDVLYELSDNAKQVFGANAAGVALCDGDHLRFVSVLGMPLVLDERRVGSLDVYANEPRTWTEASIAAGAVLADVGVCQQVLDRGAAVIGGRARGLPD